MRNVRMCLLGMITALLPFVPGCSCFQQNTQQVVLAVTDAGSDQGLSGRIVTIAPAEDRSGWILCQQRNFTPGECLDENAAVALTSSFLGVYVSSTGVDGEVALVVDSFTPCGIDVGLSGRIFCPICCVNLPADQVTGVDFYVRVETDDSSEILTVEFTPGNTVSGEFFEVTVLSIGEPIPPRPLSD